MQQQPGWYPSPGDATQLRWWDGNVWTAHTAPAGGWSQGWTGPPVRKRRIWPWIVFPILTVVVLLGVTAAIFVPRVVGAFKHPIDATNVYYGDLRDGRLPDAYQHLCAPLRNGLSYEQYVERVRQQEDSDGHITRYNAHEVHRVAGHSDQAVVDVDLTTTQRTIPVQVDMLNESGHWHFCGRR